jgi:carbon-monoxide dehydrogenase medium subunit
VPVRLGAGSAYEKLDRRAGDWAIAAGGCFVCLDGDGVVTDVGIGLTAVGAAHFCCPKAEAALRGKPASDANLKAAAEVAASETNPQTDQRGPADYKRHLAGELTKRALRRSVARARGEGV